MIFAVDHAAQRDARLLHDSDMLAKVHQEYRISRESMNRTLDCAIQRPADVPVSLRFFQAFWRCLPYGEVTDGDEREHECGDFPSVAFPRGSQKNKTG